MVYSLGLSWHTVLESAVVSVLGKREQTWFEYLTEPNTRLSVLLFNYPSLQPDGFDYLQRSVKMEFGSLTDQQPIGRPIANGPTPVELTSHLIRYLVTQLLVKCPDLSQYPQFGGNGRDSSELEICFGVPAGWGIEQLDAMNRAIQGAGIRTPAGRMMRRTLANMASFFTEQMAVDISQGINRRVQEGLFPGKAPYGFSHIRANGRRVIELNEAEAANVRRLFQLYAYGNCTLEGIV